MIFHVGLHSKGHESEINVRLALWADGYRDMDNFWFSSTFHHQGDENTDLYIVVYLLA